MSVVFTAESFLSCEHLTHAQVLRNDVPPSPNTLVLKTAIPIGCACYVRALLKSYSKIPENDFES